MRYPSLLLASAVLAMLCTGCAQPAPPADAAVSVADSVLTSGASLAAGKRVPANTFTHEDFVVMIVDFTWPNPEQLGGVHKCDWKWYHDGTLISRSPTKLIRFASTPFSLRTQRSAATLGIGHFHVETIVDDKVAATSEFQITS